MHRTNIYLDDDQRAALRQLTATSGETMSDVVRRAINRLLADEFTGRDWGAEMDALVARIDARKEPEPTTEEIQAAGQRARARREQPVHA